MLKDEYGNEVPEHALMYKRIVQECYIISHQINTSYTDLMNITPTERKYLLEFLTDEAQKNKEQNEEFMKRMNSSKNTK